jgi:multicomponent Na+:H+ antiporter subunit D
MMDLAVRLPQASDQIPVYIGLGFMVTGVMVKAAIFPMHFWLPPSYGHAPMAVTTLLAAVATKASLYILVRVLMTIFGGIDTLPQLILQWVLIPLSLMAILLGTILAIYERDAKLMLAQSSIAQIGYIVLGFGMGSLAGLQAGFIHMTNHAMIKGGMFIGLGGLAVATAGKTKLDSLAGMGRRMPLTSTGFLICGLSLIGVPLTAGFISKLYLISAVIDAGYWQIAAIVLFSSALSVIYLWRLVEVMWFTPSNSGSGNSDNERLPESIMIYAPLWILALANIWFGINASAITELSYGAAQVLIGGMI